ncbi:MAG: tyrosine--tRNA ligase [Spirochaetales bacterium]|nr:tyrosine--tRNA ligase [Spirochaetales bacterium]
MCEGLQVLQDRGFIQQCTDLEGLNNAMKAAPITFYVGVDPTGPSIHVGHMVPVFALAHLKRSGHKPVLLLGGGTARIGDPSGKTEMRKMLTYEDINENVQSIQKQLSAVVTMDGKNGWFVNNADWLANLNYIDFLREIGVHFSVNRMLTFEAYKKRMETGLTFIEFNYQLLQSYDYLELYRRKKCTLQIGGDDQWGNIVAGIDLVRREEKAEVFGLTFPLITRADGKKMGKSEQGAIFLDPTMCSVYDFYQYWRNVDDRDVEKFLKLFTFLSLDEIKTICAPDADINKAKEVLAWEYTKLIHGKEKADEAIAAAKAAFGGDGQGDLEAMPSIEIAESEFEAGINIMDLFARTSLCASKSEARRLVSQGGAIVNDEKITDIDFIVKAGAVKDGNIILKAGKKRFFRVIVK